MAHENSPYKLQNPRLSDDKEEKRFSKEWGATKDMFTGLKSNPLNMVRFPTRLEKDVVSNDR